MQRRIFAGHCKGCAATYKAQRFPDTISSTWFHGYGCCGYITTSIRYSYMNIVLGFHHVQLARCA